MNWIRNSSSIFVMASLMGFCQVGQAAVQFPFGWYLEGNAGFAKTSNNDYGTGTSASTPGGSYNVDMGYKFMPYFAGEVGYTYFPKTKVKLNDLTVATDKHYGVDLAGKGILPFVDSGAEVFAKVGVTMVRSEINASYPYLTNPIGLTSRTQTSTGLYLGFGADYSITPSMPLILQWARSVANNKTGYLDLYSVGIAYIFA